MFGLDRSVAALVSGRGVHLGSLTAVLAERYGDRILLEDSATTPGLDQGAVRSAADLERAVARLAAAHRAAGRDEGDRVLVLVGNRADTVLHALALARLGAVPVPVNPRLRPAEVAAIAAASDAGAVLADDEVADGLRDAAELAALDWTTTGTREAGAGIAAWLHANPAAEVERRRARPPCHGAPAHHLGDHRDPQGGGAHEPRAAVGAGPAGGRPGGSHARTARPPRPRPRRPAAHAHHGLLGVPRRPVRRRAPAAPRTLRRRRGARARRAPATERLHRRPDDVRRPRGRRRGRARPVEHPAVGLGRGRDADRPGAAVPGLRGGRPRRRARGRHGRVHRHLRDGRAVRRRRRPRAPALAHRPARPAGAGGRPPRYRGARRRRRRRAGRPWPRGRAAVPRCERAVGLRGPPGGGARPGRLVRDRGPRPALPRRRVQLRRTQPRPDQGRRVLGLPRRGRDGPA